MTTYKRRPGFDPWPVLVLAEQMIEARSGRKPWASDWSGGHGDPQKRYVITDTDLAELFGVTVRTIQRWRHGESKLNPILADRCAVAVGLTPVEIWAGWDHYPGLMRSYCWCARTEVRVPPELVREGRTYPCDDKLCGPKFSYTREINHALTKA